MFCVEFDFNAAISYSGVLSSVSESSQIMQHHHKSIPVLFSTLVISYEILSGYDRVCLCKPVNYILMEIMDIN